MHARSICTPARRESALPLRLWQNCKLVQRVDMHLNILVHLMADTNSNVAAEGLRALSAVVAADPAVLQLPDVRSGIENRLGDEMASASCTLTQTLTLTQR